MSVLSPVQPSNQPGNQPSQPDPTSETSQETPVSRPATPPATKRRSGSTGRFGFLRPAYWLPLAVLLVALGLLWGVTANDSPYLLPPLAAVAEALAANPLFYLTSATARVAQALVR